MQRSGEHSRNQGKGHSQARANPNKNRRNECEMLEHGKPSYKTRESERKDPTSKSPDPRDCRSAPRRPKGSVITFRGARYLREEFSPPETGSHRSGSGSELPVVLSANHLIISEGFQSSCRKL
jgi:hypothetical protein